ncbi:MAG: serine hydrolase, partial [Gammaproteobacteria bacterium]|nr:serine hydrolase [Gammaproteobacteria bacterium]
MRIRCFTRCTTIISLGLWACLSAGTGYAQPAPSAQPKEAAEMPWREASTPAEQALDAAAFQGLEAALSSQLTDVQSAVVVLRGRVVYQFYRDGDAQALRDMQSATKSALSALLGTAIAQGR